MIKTGKVTEVDPSSSLFRLQSLLPWIQSQLAISNCENKHTHTKTLFIEMMNFNMKIVNLYVSFSKLKENEKIKN